MENWSTPIFPCFRGLLPCPWACLLYLWWYWLTHRTKVYKSHRQPMLPGEVIDSTTGAFTPQSETRSYACSQCCTLLRGTIIQILRRRNDCQHERVVIYPETEGRLYQVMSYNSRHVQVLTQHLEKLNVCTTVVVVNIKWFDYWLHMFPIVKHVITHWNQ